jgi:hypothetical protein
MLLDDLLIDGWRKRLAVLASRSARACMRGCEDAAEVGVAAARLDEKGHVSSTRERHLGAGDRSYAERGGGMSELQ